MLNLNLAPKNQDLRIVRVKKKKMGGESQYRRMADLGFVEGAKVSVVNEVQGNLIVRVKDSKMALDRDLASAIYVE